MSVDKKPSTADIVVAADTSAERDVAADSTPPGTQAHDREAFGALFAEQSASGYRTRWSAIQTGFVDEPRKAVEEADALVAEVMQQLARIFADERQRLEAEWERTDRVSTEDLRQAMRRYRSFFERLLSI